jgi:uncharacterized protein YecE (DUF72 family)
LWSVKSSKFITHIKILENPAEFLDRFYGVAEGLREKLGAILFQLPPSLAFDENIFMDFCESLDPNACHALEVRHPSWINDQVFGILREFNIALCMADTVGRYPSCEAITADFVYIRLHGSRKLYASPYSEEELWTWAEKVNVVKLSFQLIISYVDCFQSVNISRIMVGSRAFGAHQNIIKLKFCTILRQHSPSIGPGRYGLRTTLMMLTPLSI